MPEFGEAVLAPRLAAAEENYWRGASTGIRERDLVNALNVLSTRLNLPDYAKTCDSQVRFLRMQMVSVSPIFMGAKAFPTDAKAISEFLSPLQALHLSLTLLDQKFWDAKYQVTPSEWQTHMPELERMTGPGPSDGNVSHSVRPHALPKAKELQDHINASLAVLGDYEGLSMLSDLLTRLGIQ